MTEPTFDPRPPPREALLWRRDEACVAQGGGVVVTLALTAFRSAWLADHERLFLEVAARAGGPVPMLAIVRLDKRFPIDVGFDANLAELARTLGALRGALSAVAIVLEFGGIMAATFKASLGVVTLLAGGRLPPFSHHPTPGSALRWLTHERGLTSVDPAGALAAVHEARAALGVGDSWRDRP